MAKFKKFSKKANDDINIILLGESGVGKSTFINALSNYFNFATFDDARNGELVTVLPAFFTITDEKYQQIKIKIGNENANEQDATGKAATQNAKTHTVVMKDYTVNIIDTPGIGDPEGFAKDKENFENTIKYISSYKNLNGVCILLKPNNARLDLHFRYCFKELLVHLHKKAAPNIVFCFTNTRGTFYRPGDSLPPLEKLVKDVEKESRIKIPLGQDNIFCFDNESFRFLAALKQGVKFSQQEVNDFSTSWDHSYNNALGMMEYITKLPIHDIFDTVKLNEARQILMELSKPIAELSQNIQVNIKLAEDKMAELEKLEDGGRVGNMTMDELKKKLYIEQIDYERVPLQRPRTVCTDHNCTRQIKVGTIDKIDYVTHCHPECYLDGITTEAVGVVELKKCAAMKGNDNCQVCGHHYGVHMHIMYENKEKSEKVIDANIENMMRQKEDKKKILEDAIQSTNELIEQLKKEQEEIIEISAKFAAFTKDHAIIVFNDDLDAYLELLIKEEESKKQAGGNNEQVLDGLRHVKKSYDEQKKIFDKALKSKKGGDASIDVNQIDDLVNELCNLPCSGDKMKPIIDDIKHRKAAKKH